MSNHEQLKAKIAAKKAARAVVPFVPKSLENVSHSTTSRSGATEDGAMRRVVEKDGSWTIGVSETNAMVEAAIRVRPIEAPVPPAREDEILGAFTIPVVWNVRIIGGALAMIGTIILVFITLSLADLMLGFHVITGKKGAAAFGWSLAFDVFYIAVETLIIFAPQEMVSRVATPAKYSIMILSMGCNSFAFFVDATANDTWPVLSAIVGALIPVLIAVGTEMIGHAVAVGRKRACGGR